MNTDTEHLQAVAATQGLAALMDHLGLDGLGNRVIAYERIRRAAWNQPAPSAELLEALADYERMTTYRQESP